MSVKIFHHNDADGYVAAYQAYKYYEKSVSVTDIEFYEMDYKDKEKYKGHKKTVVYIFISFSVNYKNRKCNNTKHYDVMKLIRYGKDTYYEKNRIYAKL